MNRLFPLLWAVLVLAGCQTAVRAPLCRDGETALPPGAEGRYHLVISGASTAFSGAWTSMDETTFEIKERADSYEIGASKPLKLKGASKHSRGGSAGLVTPAMALDICKINGAYYSQAANGDGTYALSRVDVSTTGITLTSLVFDPDELERAGFKSYFLPNLSFVDSDGKWWFDAAEPTRLIIDNTNLTDAQRDTLVQFAKPTPFGIVFSRVETPKRSTEPLAIKWRLQKP